MCMWSHQVGDSLSHTNCSIPQDVSLLLNCVYNVSVISTVLSRIACLVLQLQFSLIYRMSHVLCAVSWNSPACYGCHAVDCLCRQLTLSQIWCMSTVRVVGALRLLMCVLLLTVCADSLHFIKSDVCPHCWLCGQVTLCLIWCVTSWLSLQLRESG